MFILHGALIARAGCVDMHNAAELAKVAGRVQWRLDRFGYARPFLYALL
jgi:hypothetical protein